jgi:hypothetical protein
MPVVPEGAGVRYESPVPGFNKTYTHLQYALGFKVSKIAYQRDQFGVFTKLASGMGKIAAETQELAAAYNFNRGFDPTFPGFDGVPLFSPSHPLIKASGVQSNMLPIAADPDVDSIRALVTLARRTKSQVGAVQRIVPKKLIVPPELAFVTNETTFSKGRSDTANRADNMFGRDMGFGTLQDVMVWDYLTDPHAWFLQADIEETELRFYEAEKFNLVHGVDFETRSLKTAGWMQFSCSWNSYFGILGAPSA